MSHVLFFAAVFPIFLLCFYVYKKDPNKEPFKLLLKIFFYGFISAIPVVFVENILAPIFPTEKAATFTGLLINVFFGVALVEEAFKWFVVKLFGYNNKEFDEVYDIIVYSVFSSLGFACIENILYVFNPEIGGLNTAVSRALFSIPGHMCFGVLMGYYFAKAKLSSQNKQVHLLNMLSSIVVPCVFHALYDTLLFTGNALYVLIFFVYDIFMVVACMLIIKKMSKIQNNVKVNIENGNIIKENGQLVVKSSGVNFCPVCGNPANGGNYCTGCGNKLP